MVSFAPLTLHMQNVVLCIHVESHNTGITFRCVILLLMPMLRTKYILFFSVKTWFTNIWKLNAHVAHIKIWIKNLNMLAFHLNYVLEPVKS